MTNSTGVVQNTYSYDPYGKKLSTTGSVANAIQYSGGYFDSATGLNKFGARYYNSTEGRWTQLDPSGKNPGYQYVGDNPINNMDPSGLSWEDPYDTLQAAATGCVAGLATTVGVAAATTAISGGTGLGVSGVELGLGCAFGWIGGAQDSLAGNGASSGINTIDLFLTFRGFRF